jgi:hypothetical protein
MSDAAKEENLGEWVNICQKFCIPQRSSEPYHQHQNKVKCHIQDIILMREHTAHEKYWDFAAEYAVELINHTAARQLHWRTPYEDLHGETPDMSVFRFSFFEPIYYLDPHTSYPQPNMLPSRFLGIARTTEDSFTFIIIQDTPKTGIVLHRSIIQKRNSKEIKPRTNYALPTIMAPNETECLSTISISSNKTIDADMYNEIIVEDIQNPTNDIDTCIIHAENEKPDHDSLPETIYNHYNNDYKQADIQDIIGLERHADDGKLYVKVRWKNQQESLILAEHICSENPLRLAEFLRDNPVKRTRTGYWNTWAKNTINTIGNTKRKL